MRLFKPKHDPVEQIGEHPDDPKVVSMFNDHDVTTLFDIGANVGQYARRMRRAGYKGQIISFDPLQTNVDILNELASSDPKWMVAPKLAVGNGSGEIIMNVSEHNDMSSILEREETLAKALKKSKYVAQESAQLVKLDDIFGDYVANPGQENVVIKIDTQGYELPILEGAVKTIEAGYIIGFQLELSLVPLYTGEPTYETVTTWLKQRSYHPYFLMSGYYSKKLKRQLQVDGIFFREDV